ncbi:MAG TPA: cytochrome d ubiquinol oxidase subunit II [Polyangiaceae bacterium]
MPAVFFAIVAVMLTAWAVLDGFDFGVGIVHRIVARTEEERGRALATVLPVWDGNEVWLVAGGAVLLLAFPRAYAAAMSGMYLALIMVLWLLVFRGVSIELRGHVDHPLWRAAWDSMFALSSTVLAFVAGVALGNVVRGVPIGPTGWFQLDLFAIAGDRVAAIDGYTGTIGLLSVVLLAAHGASYVAWKTDGGLRERASSVAKLAWRAAVPLAVVATVVTGFVRPAMFAAIARRPWVWPLAASAIGSTVVAFRALAAALDRRAFLASSALIASLLLATAGGLYPTLIPSTVDPAYDIDAYGAASGHHGLVVGLFWWVPAIVLVVLYFANLFWLSRGKVTAEDADAHHG